MTPRPRIALATSRELANGIEEDHALPPAFDAVGADAGFVVWDDARVDWSTFDAVLVRTCWDYYRRSREFVDWISRVEAAGTLLLNPPDVMRWNHDKRYLRALAAAGVPVVPTRFVEPGARVDLGVLMDGAGWPEVVVKPVVGAGAFEQWRTTRDGAAAVAAAVDAAARRCGVLVQPFLPEIADAGEWSVIFFGGVFSHAVLKRPARGDYRVQPQYGGVTTREDAPPALVAAARAALAAVPCHDACAYARVDGVVRDGVFTLMEIELIEPRLFLDLGPGAAGRLARAAVARVGVERRTAQPADSRPRAF